MAVPKVAKSLGGRSQVKGPGYLPGNKVKKKPVSQSMFPSSDVTSGEMARLLQSSKNQVSQIYGASPLPNLQTYQQPFIDAANHEAKLGTDMLAAIGGAAQSNQGLTDGMTQWIQQNIGGAAQQAQAAAGPGNMPTPQYTTAAASALPIQSMGTSQTQYLNSLAPYVAGSSQQYQRNITTQQAKALQDYNAAVQDRSSSQIKDTQDLYQTNLKSMQAVRQNVTKNAIAEYIALTTAGMKADAATEKVRKDTADILRDIRAGDINQQNADAHTVSSAASDYRAHNPATSTTSTGKAGKSLQAALKAANSEYNKSLGTATPVQRYQRTVKITYQGTNSLTGNTNPTTTATFTVDTSDPNDPGIKAQFAAWKKANPKYAGASITDSGKATATTVPGAMSHNYPGLGTNWQNALTVFAQQMAGTKKPGETPQQFRSRMAKIYEGYKPRPKAKK